MTFSYLAPVSLRKIVPPGTWIGLLCLIAVAAVSACSDWGQLASTSEPAATRESTATRGPVPTPTPIPDEQILDVSVVIPNRQYSDNSIEWKDLIKDLTRRQATDSGAQPRVESRSGDILEQLSDDHDVIVWMVDDGHETFDHFDGIEILKYAERSSRELFQHSAALLEWIARGGVFVFQGNVHPVGFPQDVMPHSIESQEYGLQNCYTICELSLTGDGRRALAAEWGWPPYVGPAIVDVYGDDFYIATYQNLARAWEVWGVTADLPAIVAAKHGDGWVILSQLAHRNPDSEYAMGLLRAALVRADVGAPEKFRPDGVTDDVIQATAQIIQEAGEGLLTRSQAQSKLVRIAVNIGLFDFAWIIANTPVLDLESGEVTLSEEYAIDLSAESDADSLFRFQEDPIGTTVDLMFERPDHETIREWLGVDE